MQIWTKRYPSLDFLLSFFSYEKVELCSSTQGINQWLLEHPLEEVEVLYIIGLIDYPLPDAIVAWLSQKSARVLVFIENALGAFASFSQSDLVDHPQIHFHYAETTNIEELASQFPTDRLEIFEGKTFDTLTLKRRSAALSAVYSDVLYSHKIVGNLLKNFQRMSSCLQAKNAFHGKPAIICGAGPSLEKSFSTLHTLKDKALLIAAGSAITALTKNQIQPHIAIAVDPNYEEFERLQQALFFEGLFLFAPRLHKDVFATANGPFGYLRTSTGGLLETLLEDSLQIEGPVIGEELGSEAFSSTTLAVSYAYFLGCNPIVFNGVDLAFAKEKRYAKGVEIKEEFFSDPRALEEKLQALDIYGNKTTTLLKWVMESDCLSAFASKAQGTKFFNASQGGIGFKGIENTDLETIFSNTYALDMQGEIHQWIQGFPLMHTEKFADLVAKLYSSLQSCKEHCLAIIEELKHKKESGKLLLFISDFSEEYAYIHLLYAIDIALEGILPRYFPDVDPKESKWKKEFAKYQELIEQIKRFEKVFAEFI